MIGWLALISLALGQSRSERALVQRALVSEALRGDLARAISRYQQLVRTLPDDHPLWTVAIVAYARALYDEGRVAEAREALREAIRKGRCEADCQQLLQHVAIDQESVRTLPVEWSFDNQNPGLYHHWAHQDLGELVAGPGALSWTTRADPDPKRSDKLVAGFVRPEPPPSRLEFTLRSVQVPSWVRVVLEDEAGSRFVTHTVEVPANEVLTVEALVADVVAEDPTTRLDPGRITRVSLEDLTGSRRPGAHTIQILAFRAE